MGRCTLCRQPGTANNKLNKHHIRGKNFPDVMLTHTRTCHWFAQWVTNLWLQAGKEKELTEFHIIYLFNRVITLRDNVEFLFP